MADNRDDLPADEQFPIVDPEALREFLAVSRMPRGWRAGDTAAAVTVELTASQAQFLAARGKRRYGLEGEAAIKREVENLISQDVSASRMALARHFSPWLDMILKARLAPQLERLRKATRGK